MLKRRDYPQYDHLRDEWITRQDMRDWEVRARPWWRMTVTRPDGSTLATQAYYHTVTEALKHRAFIKSVLAEANKPHELTYTLERHSGKAWEPAVRTYQIH